VDWAHLAEETDR